MRKRVWIAIVIVAAVIGLAGIALAQNLPKLPDAHLLRQSPGSPGQVTFLHVSHLGERPDCTRCHPKLFGIVKQSPTRAAAERRITHANMEKGRQCGACHNGKAAFGFDDCTACHRQ